MTTQFNKHPLLALSLSMLVVYGWFAWRFPLIPRYAQKLADVRTFAPTMRGGLVYALVLLSLFLICWQAYRLARTVKPSPQFMLASSFLIGLPLLFVYPINANDVFRYVLRGRVMAVHGANPYVSPPSDYPNDPFAHLAGEWASATSPYGPIWELTDAAVSWFSGDNLLMSLLAFKLLGLLTFVACGWFIVQLVPHRALLWCWNPACYLMFVVDAHNDVLMLLWLFMALWIGRVLRLTWQRATVAVCVAVLSPLTKLTGIVFLPFLAISLLSRLSSQAQKTRYILFSALGSLCLTLLTFVPFGDPRLLVTRLLSETQGGGAFSPTIYLYFVDQRIDAFSIEVARLFEIGTPLFIGFALLAVVWAFFGRNPLRAAADTYFAYLLTALNFRIWYALWVFPWTLIDDSSEWRLRFGYLFLVTSQLSVVLYGHVRQFYFNTVDIAHLWGIPFVFALPLLGVVLWNYANSRTRE